ncbi:MAG: hypothetical protein LR005_01385 [Candidatus Pacebacteria bacterium]|nr:hypothetical protein [Candidatus Paceibacterota bacterium]
MKNINLKKIMYAALGGVLGLALFISLSGDATATGASPGFQAFQMAEKSDNTKKLSDDGTVLSNNAERAIFRLAGTAVFGNMLSFGQTRFHELAVGYPDQNVPDDVELSVNGTITIKELADPTRGDALVPACVNDFGVISLCS